MRVICAPDSYKESMSAVEAADAMARGVAAADPSATIDRCPVSDGGEGFVEALGVAAGGRMMTSRVQDPLGGPTDAVWALLPDGTAVIEMAAASGLERLQPHERDPRRTSTFGTGQLILAALDVGCSRILLGIGGSATNDGGVGMAQALGVRFTLADQRLPATPLCGGMLASITAIDLTTLDPRLCACPVTVACDVTNPLTGPSGAAAVYGPQKCAPGLATPDLLLQLDQGLAHLAKLLGTDPTSPGSGAAGGLGYGLVAFLGARLRRGIEVVLDAVDFDSRVADSTLCLTGEGRIDGQTASGKTVLGIARAAAARGVPTIALVGSTGEGVEQTLEAGLSDYRVIGPGLSAEESMRRGPHLLAHAAEAVVREFAMKPTDG